MKKGKPVSSQDPNPYEPLIAAIEGLNSHTQEQTTSIQGLAAAVLGEAEARDRKVETLQRLTTIMVRLTGILLIGILLLIGIGAVNLYNTSRTNNVARSVASTNSLLLSCLQPNTPCSNTSAAAQKAQNDQIRQTVFVLFVCSRLNPSDPNTPDPSGNTARLVACVKTYYPEFKLPAQAGK